MIDDKTSTDKMDLQRDNSDRKLYWQLLPVTLIEFDKWYNGGGSGGDSSSRTINIDCN